MRRHRRSRCGVEGLEPRVLFADGPDLQPGTTGTRVDPLIISTVGGTSVDAAQIAAGSTLFVDVVIANAGNLSAGAFTLTLKLDGVVVDTIATTPLGAGSVRTILDRNLGVVAPGEHTLLLELDTTAAVAETHEANNSRVRKFFVGTPPTGEIHGVKWADDDDGGVRDAGEPGLAGWTVYADLDGDAALDAGEPSDVTDGAGAYDLLNLPTGVYTVREVAKTGFEQSFPAASGASNHDFEVEPLFPDASLTPSQRAAFVAAAARWEQIIRGDLADVFVAGLLVDDVRVEATATVMDGAGGTVALSAPQATRAGSLLPITARTRFDSADVATLESAGDLVDVFVHEIGHALGFGTLWSAKGLITGAGTSNPRFTGTQATAAFNAIFNPDVASVPVENVGGAGSIDVHWRESVMDAELMTSSYDVGVVNPLSRITAASMIDLGYAGVELNAADAYVAPGPSADAVAADAVAFAHEVHLDPGEVITGIDFGGFNAPPSIASLTAAPEPVLTGGDLTLTAVGVADVGAAGGVTGVAFYRETNGVGGLQTPGDTLVGADGTSPYSITVSTTGLPLGAHTYYARATDNAGAVGNVVSTTSTVQAQSATPGVPDLVAASDTGSSNADDVTNRDNGAAGRTLEFQVAGTVAGATVTVLADGVVIGSATSTGATTTVTTNGVLDLPDGVHAITARQAEPGKIISPLTAALNVTVDTVAPAADVADVSPDPRGSAVNSIAVTFTRPVTGFDLADLSLTRDGGASLLSGSQTLTTGDNATFTLNNLAALTAAPGAYVLALAAGGSGIADALAGNALLAGASDAWVVAPPPAVVSVQRLDANPTSAPSVQFQVTFSVPVTGFGAGDLALAVTGGVTGASIDATVQGAGSVYVVTVHTGTGDGTIGLNVVDDDSVADALGTPLGGIGAGNGNFTGQAYSVDRTTPHVVEVFVAGSAWTPAFRNFLATSGAGEAAFGFRVDAIDPTNELPWVSLNQVSVRFNEDVTAPSAGHLTVIGVNSPVYALAAGVAYDAVTFTATWTLDTPGVRADKLLLQLGALTDAAGNALAGDSAFRVNVLPGDVNRTGGAVNAADVTATRAADGTAPGSPAYSIFRDVDGSGAIGSTDVLLVRNRQGSTLPAGEPVPPLPDGAIVTVGGPVVVPVPAPVEDEPQVVELSRRMIEDLLAAPQNLDAARIRR